DDIRIFRGVQLDEELQAVVEDFGNAKFNRGKGWECPRGFRPGRKHHDSAEKSQQAGQSHAVSLPQGLASTRSFPLRLAAKSAACDLPSTCGRLPNRYGPHNSVIPLWCSSVTA